MTTGDSRVADLNSYFANIYEDAVFVAREQNIATRLVRVFTDGNGDQTRTLTTYPTITPVSVAETDDFALPTRMDKNALATLTPGEIMAQVILTDRRIETDPQNARQDAATELGAGAATKIDSDILGNFNALTGGTVGASGTTMIWGYLYAAMSILRKNSVPRPYYCVLHPYQWHDLGKAASVAGSSVVNAPQFQDEVMRSFWVSNVGGLDGIYVSANCEVSGTDAYGAVFNPAAIAFDIRRDLRLEPERDASKRAWELNLTALYAHGVWRPTYGVQILTDITTPTS
jgi:hypothetical protein